MQCPAFAIRVVETPELCGCCLGIQTILYLVKQREHISLTQLNRFLHHLC